MAQEPIDIVIERVSRTYGSWSKTTTIEEMREDWDRLFWSDQFPARVEPVDAGGVQATWIEPNGVDPATALIYFHGGGFAVGSVRSHYDMIARIAAASGMRALGVDYRRSPDHPFPAAFDDAVAVARWVVALGIDPRKIAFAGDSAGACLVLGAAIALRDAGESLPAALVGLSPWTDLAATGASYETRAMTDPIHQRVMVLAMARRYLGKTGDSKDPRVSPLYADLSGLPPTLLQVGDRETVLDDAVRYAEKARQAGGNVELEVWDRMIHVFQQFPDVLPEAGEAIAKIGTFLRHHVDVAGFKAQGGNS